MGHPYREKAVLTKPFIPQIPWYIEIINKIKTIFQSKKRKYLIKKYGTFKERNPVCCPVCGKRSWDPELIRQIGPNGMGLREFVLKANNYKCGHRGKLSTRVEVC